MTAPSTARARARAELTSQIKQIALRQLTTSGASELSLRAVARELGLVSSAVYRYFSSRDELLTALIMDAYDDLAAAMEHADADLAADQYARRWHSRCTAMRSWGCRNAQRFALIYGSPVPGYRAPADTIAPAGRVMAALFGLVDEAARAGVLPDTAAPADPTLTAQLRDVAVIVGPGIAPATLSRVVAAFGQVIGLINLELGGHFVGGFEPADALFGHCVDELAEFIGLADLGSAPAGDGMNRPRPGDPAGRP